MPNLDQLIAPHRRAGFPEPQCHDRHYHGCRIISVETHVGDVWAGEELTSDGYHHHVFAADGRPLGEAGTLGLALAIARSAGRSQAQPVPVAEAVVSDPDDDTQTEG